MSLEALAAELTELLTRMSLVSGKVGANGHVILGFDENATRWQLLADSNAARSSYGLWKSKFWEASTSLHSEVGSQALSKAVDAFVVARVKQPTPVTKNALANIIKELHAAPKTTFHVVRPLIGASWLGDQPLQFGPALLARPTDHLAALSVGLHVPETAAKILSHSHTVVRVIVQAMDADAAFRRGDISLRRVENVLRYFAVGLNDHQDIGILDARELRQFERMAFSAKTANFGVKNDGPLHTMELNVADVDSWGGRQWLEAALAAEKPNEMQTRVFGALEWLSRAIANNHSGTRMAQLMFALEVLLQGNREIIAPSVMSHLSETAALLLGTSVQGRTAIEKNVKRLYGRRSDLVHGRSEDVSDTDVQDLFEMVMETIGLYTTHPSVSTMTSFNQVERELRRLKYAGGPFPDQVVAEN